FKYGSACGVWLRNAKRCIVRNNIINNFETGGVCLNDSDSNEVYSNSIGADPNITLIQSYGIQINGGEGNLIGGLNKGNIISAYSFNGVYVLKGRRNSILNNSITTDYKPFYKQEGIMISDPYAWISNDDKKSPVISSTVNNGTSFIV